MRTFRFDKLVRDKIAKSVTDSGGKVDSRILNDSEFLVEAKKKLLEEAQEFLTADENKIAEELSDVEELIDLICHLKGIKAKDLKKIRSNKATKAGAFKKRIYINTVNVPENSKWVKYYLSQPDRYPEVK